MRSDRSAEAVAQILENIERARALTQSTTPEAFAESWRDIYAAVRCLEIISEATRRLSDDLKARHPSIPWRDIADAGNVYRHAYEIVSARRVWDTVVEALPSLEAALRSEITPPA